jgi:TrmH family RNA methyltransferase
MPDTDKTITSAANPLIKRLRSLDQKKHRDEAGVFLVEGARAVQEAVLAGWQPETVVYSPRGAGEALLKTLRGEKVEVTDDLLGRITGKDNPQSVLAVFRQRQEELTAVSAGLWVGLESIRDPGNLGTIIRTADAAGAQGVMLIGECCDPWSPEAVRASVGSFARVKIVEVSMKSFPAWRKSWKGRVIGTHLAAAEDYRKMDYAPPLLLLMGSEQNGLSPELVSVCDKRVKIPMTGGAESLNLAVATGIMLYEVGRGRL